MLGAADQLRLLRAAAAREAPLGRVLTVLSATLLLVGVEVLTNLLSIPVYLLGSPQKSFPLAARRQGQTYRDSYVRYKHAVLFTLGLIIVTILAAASAFLVAVVIPHL